MKNSKPVYNATVQLKKIISSIIEKSKIVCFVFETLILFIICFLRFVFWNFLPKHVKISEIRY
jgi:hypothetical protein